MKTSPPSGYFLNKGALVFTNNELTTIIHALMVERDRVVRANGDRYGLMSIEDLNQFIEQLRVCQKERGN